MTRSCRQQTKVGEMARSGLEGREIDCSKCSHSQCTDDKVYELQSRGRNWRDKKQMSVEERWQGQGRRDETETSTCGGGGLWWLAWKCSLQDE